MRLGVISDTHDYIERTRTAIARMRDLGAEEIIHCGDIESVRTVALFADIPTHWVFGNWDERNSTALEAAIAAHGGTFHPDFGYLDRGGKRIAWLHSHRRGQLRELEKWQEFDFIFYGHTHKADARRSRRTWLINPGAMYRAKPPMCLVFDPELEEFDWIELPESTR